MSPEDTPVIIIGAPRSGTNMLRDLLAGVPGFGTWPCDEIDAIWRHGNLSFPTDEFPVSLATEQVSGYIRNRFQSLAETRRLQTVVEKTCANSLRVAFVNRIFPKARFLFLVRDGRDATASAMKRWQGALDLKYQLRKARFVPLSDVPHYGFRFLRNRVFKLWFKQKRLASWGPGFDGMAQALEEHDLAAVCALQWTRCVDLATRQLSELSPGRVFKVRYEEFVQQPAQGLERVTRFLGIDLPSENASALSTAVTHASIGKWKSDLTPEEAKKIEPILSNTLTRHEYV